MDNRPAGQVSATPAALSLLAEIAGAHGRVVLHVSGGCCDGSAPMCYPAGELVLGDRDILVGWLGDVPLYMAAAQFEAWGRPHLVIDAAPGRGGVFSLDNGLGRRFVLRVAPPSRDERS
ncbi:DUF779 domain-containing protein [Rubellimicrobium sp. CFH 75288]|uniref:DUF779 domain-containing protein n=1 Tax=Rubellimicrobium sp. CFH 75288 TaxID=2697034 RepID=UPI00141298A7|nr:DUF779 domain-containing protein [Rubellimicrobium sp. CFH 75288]NAZ36996.1 DUF779 domain-containing protein [Rubellimicrobium sp. CFH 75288]